MYGKKTHRTNEVFKLLKFIKTKTTISFKKTKAHILCSFFINYSS